MYRNTRFHSRNIYPLLMLFTLIAVEPTLGQAFTFDYLTYSDYFESRKTHHRTKATAFAFFATNEFDASGKASADNISYTEYCTYVAFRIVFTNKFQLNIAPKVGWLTAEGVSGTAYGTPWIWAKYVVPLRNRDVAIRIAFHLGKIGKSFWLEDNKIDVGLLIGKSFGPFSLDGTVSYRLRRKSNQSLLDFGGLYDEAGNELHYKLESSLFRKKTFSLNILAFGYWGGKKKLDGAKLPDSHSYKTSVGSSIRIYAKSDRFFALSLLYDIIGRHDKRGLSLVFNMTY